MLRITIDFLPGGSSLGRKTLGVAEIKNDGTGTPSVGDYSATLCLTKAVDGRRAWKFGKVTNFARKQYNSWDLLYLALKSCLSEERIKKLECQE